MADVVYRANLKAASFPLLAEQSAGTVIVRKQDQNFIAGLAAKESLDSSIGVPQIYYCHNVVPVDTGYRSVGYNSFIASALPDETGFSSIQRIYDDAGNSAYIALAATGVIYVLKDGASAWIVPTGAPSAASCVGKRITVGHASGISYIYISTIGCFIFSWSTDSFSSVDLTGVLAADVLGVVADHGYLIAYSSDSVIWSSTLTPTDFTPSLETGAGGGMLEQAKGSIVTIQTVYQGFIVFTTNNAVGVIISGNVLFPYTFVEVAGAGGITSPDTVSYDVGSDALYAYTTSGLQIVGLKSATNVFPEVTDFLSGNVFEDFNETTLEFTTISAADVLTAKKLTVIASRYLILSYGITSLTHALYYDILFKQWGKLKVTHVSCFELRKSTGEVAKNSIAFLTAAGSISTLETDINGTLSGIMILGKFQYVRDRLLQLQGAEIENVASAATFSLYDLPTYDGKTFQPAVAGYLNATAAKCRQYLFHNTARNHSLVLKGSFDALNVLLTFNVHGAR